MNSNNFQIHKKQQFKLQLFNSENDFATIITERSNNYCRKIQWNYF